MTEEEPAKTEQKRKVPVLEAIDEVQGIMTPKPKETSISAINERSTNEGNKLEVIESAKASAIKKIFEERTSLKRKSSDRAGYSIKVIKLEDDKGSDDSPDRNRPSEVELSELYEELMAKTVKEMR